MHTGVIKASMESIGVLFNVRHQLKHIQLKNDIRVWKKSLKGINAFVDQNL